MPQKRRIIGLLILFIAICLCDFGMCDGKKPLVGVVDSQLVSQENWVSEWKSEWDSRKIAAQFEANGVNAVVIGADALKNADTLRSYTAIMIPTDECYLDEGSKDGPISRNIATYVRAGGIYIMPMGASHFRYRDVATGKVVEAVNPLATDFLGLDWKVVGDIHGQGAAPVITPAGQKLGLSVPQFSKPMATYTRVFTQVGDVYAASPEGQPCLYSGCVGKGIVIHYAGGFPLNSEVRRWLVDSYTALLKAGLDPNAIRWGEVSRMRVYDSTPVAARSEKSGNEMSLNGDWEVAQAPNGSAFEAVDSSLLEWKRVKLPNTIQYALFQSGFIDNPWFADNWKKLQWIHQTDWYLRRSFVIPSEWNGKCIRLRFDGMDYTGVVWLDGKPLGVHEGASGGPTFDITSRVKPGENHELVVRLLHETDTSKVMKSNAVDGTNYIWGNKFRSIGLWQSIRLISSGRAFMEAPLVRTDKIGPGSAELWAQTMIHNTGAPSDSVIEARIVDLANNQVVWKETQTQYMPSGNSYYERKIEIKNPKLWWPNGMGAQPLYRMELVLKDADKTLDEISSRFGIRTIEMMRNPYLKNKPRSNPPRPDIWLMDNDVENDSLNNADESYRFLFVVNGRPLYAKGACWMTSDELLNLSPQREGWMINAAKHAGLNMFRLNGGTNIFETEQFYNLCDENGILVWQELPLNWSRGVGVPLIVWREQIKQTVLRLRQHPSMAVYVGGNEFAPYVELVATYLGIAREIISAYDNRPFRMSSPGGGAVHAYYPFDVYSADPNWYPYFFDESVNFASEWSCTVYTNLSEMKRVVPKSELGVEPIGYDCKQFVDSHPMMHERFAEVNLDKILRHSFNRASWYNDLAKTDIADYIDYTQMAQANTYGYVFEHWRAQFPYKSGETVWMFNPIAPVSSWNMIDWFGQPLMSYYSTKRADEPVHVMAKTNFFSWAPGDTFHASVFALNDGIESLKGAHITARIFDFQMKPVVTESWSLTVPSNGMKSSEKEIKWAIPQASEGYFFLELTMNDSRDKRLSRQAYCMRSLKSLSDPQVYKKWQSAPSWESLTTKGPWLRPQLAGVPTTLSAKIVNCISQGKEAKVSVVIRNTGKYPAYPARLSISPDKYSSIWDDNYFWLAPGESVLIRGTVRIDMSGIDPMTAKSAMKLSDLALTVSAWNAPVLDLHLTSAQ